MAWQKGQSGNPKGRASEKPYAEALRMELAAAGDNRKELRLIARAHIEAAKSGDLQAINALADRLDGKPAQESTVTIDDKRDASDWTRDELVAFLNDAKTGSNGAAEARGSEDGPDSVH